jgi:hypothetical protein
MSTSVLLVLEMMNLDECDDVYDDDWQTKELGREFCKRLKLRFLGMFADFLFIWV